MRLLIFCLLTALIACQPSKTTSDVLYTNVTNPIDAKSETAISLIGNKTVEVVVDKDYEMVDINVPLYTTPCISAKKTTASIDKTELTPAVTISCSELTGPWKTAFVWTIAKTSTGMQWTICPALVRPSVNPGDTIFVHAQNVRLNPNDYDERLLVQD